MFAPLIRDGRMEKFYWQPSEDDLIGILHQVSEDPWDPWDPLGFL